WDGDCLDALQKAEDQRDLEEEYRLLYVAMTRAEDQLHVMGCTRFSKKSGEKIVEQGWYKAVLDGMFAAKATPHNAPELGLVDDWFEEIWWSQESKGMVFGKQAEAHEHDARTEEVPVEIAKPDLPAWCLRKPPRESAGFALLRPSELIETHSGQPGDPVRQHAMRRGRFVHRLLEWVPKIPPDQREERIQHYVAANGADLDPADLADITRKILALLERPECAALFGPASRSEVRFAQMIKTDAASDSGYHTVIGRIDRLVLYQDTILIVEYKSSKTIPQTPEQIKPAQLRQLAAYRDAAGAIYPDRSIETLMIWTDGPIIMNVPHHLLDQQAVWKV
ncbi:MAG: PD-(D/E)XK nuclease family protein, partial [Pseudomonadota bacterium]